MTNEYMTEHFQLAYDRKLQMSNIMTQNWQIKSRREKKKTNRISVSLPKGKSKKKIVLVVINFYTLISSVPHYHSSLKMSSSSNIEFKEIPKKYIDPLAPKDKGEGSRVNGKNWKIKKDAFRVRTIGVVSKTKKNSFKQRELKKLEEEQYKARMKELKDEKETARKQKFDDLKRRREIKEEKERYERMASKMHAKKVERMRKREKRNKLLKER